MLIDLNRLKFFLKQSLFNVTVIIAVTIILGCQQNLLLESETDKQNAIATMYREFAREFSEVEGISVEQLQQLQQQEKNIVLVDVRTPKERGVSIIPGAITKEEFETNLEKYDNGKNIIVAYCTIGYRSGKYADGWRKQGINILNLEGSLLAWSHIKGKLVNDSGRTNRVHVFGRQWQLTADNYQPVW